MVSEERVREIVREEIARALKIMPLATGDLAGYGSDHIDRVAAGVMDQATETLANLIVHADDCTQLSDDWRERAGRCSCGARDY